MDRGPDRRYDHIQQLVHIQCLSRHLFKTTLCLLLYAAAQALISAYEAEQLIQQLRVTSIEQVCHLWCSTCHGRCSAMLRSYACTSH